MYFKEDNMKKKLFRERRYGTEEIKEVKKTEKKETKKGKKKND